MTNSKGRWVQAMYNGKPLRNILVSETGKVRTLNFRGIGITKEIKLCNNGNGYFYFLQPKGENWTEKKAFTVYIHRLVWETFNEEIPKGFQIDHCNGNKADNRLCNLELVTPKQNCRRRHFTNVGNVKRNWIFIPEIDAIFESKVAVARHFNITGSYVQTVLHRGNKYLNKFTFVEVEPGFDNKIEPLF